MLVGLKGVDKSILISMIVLGERDGREAGAMIRVQYGRISSLRIEGMSLTTGTVECDLPQDASEFWPPPHAARRKAHAPGMGHNEQSDRNAEQEKQE